MTVNLVNKSVLLPVATKPSQVRGINNDCKKFPKNRFIAFGSLHPRTENFQEEIDFLKSDNVPGIKLHPEYQDFYVDSTDMYPIYEALSGAGMITVIHAGKDPGPFTCDHALPKALRKIKQNFPDLKIVAAHLGGWNVWDDVENTLCGLPIYFDTAAVHGFLPDEEFLRIVRKHGIEKILFGTDTPWFDLGAVLKWIDQLKLSDSDKDSILYKNATDLLGF
jgi:predicted TIM-barrel fold metal-dependent hydrolase